MERFNIFTFDKTHDAISAEKMLKDGGFNARVIPVPGDITAGCGLAIKVNEDEFKQVALALKDKGLITTGLYAVEKTGLKRNTIAINLNYL